MNLWNELNSMSPAKREAVLAQCKSLPEWELEDAYLEMLNECHETVNICGYDYEAGDALRRVDPVAYRCGFADYLGTNECQVEWNGKYYDSYDVENAICRIESQDEEMNVEAAPL